MGWLVGALDCTQASDIGGGNAAAGDSVMAWRIEVITPCAGAGVMGDSYHPLLGDRYDFIRWEDVTGIPGANLQPSPNIYVVLAEVTAAVLNNIELDNVYYILSADLYQEDTDRGGV